VVLWIRYRKLWKTPPDRLINGLYFIEKDGTRCCYPCWHNGKRVVISENQQKPNRLWCTGCNRDLAKEFEREAQSTLKLNPDEEKILVSLQGKTLTTAEAVASRVKLSLEKTEYWLYELQEKRYVTCSGTSYGVQYDLEQKGREYLMRHELIN
jgi:hypothetical protein